MSRSQTSKMPQLVTFRDSNPFNRPDVTGYNNIGFITQNGIVKYAKSRRVAEIKLASLTKLPHKMFSIEGNFCPRALESFFTKNMPCADLFHDGIRAICSGDFRYFDQPIKLPILEPLSPQELDLRWNVLTSVIKPGDMVSTFDCQSRISRLIAYADRGPWSHTCTYVGDGKVLEALTTGVTERDISAYRSGRYRLGVYRLTGVAEEQVNKSIEFMRSQLGKPYNYRSVVKLGFLKTFGLRPKNARRLSSPNDLSRSKSLHLIHTV